MYFKTCSYCGSYLDPGERCDCRDLRKNEAAPAATETASIKKSEKSSDLNVAPAPAPVNTSEGGQAYG